MSRESEMVVLKRDKSGRATIFCDPEIVDLVKALNDGGVPTVASCSGHGEKYGSIALKDGRCLIITPTLQEHNRIFKLTETELFRTFSYAWDAGQKAGLKAGRFRASEKRRAKTKPSRELAHTPKTTKGKDNG